MNRRLKVLGLVSILIAAGPACAESRWARPGERAAAGDRVTERRDVRPSAPVQPPSTQAPRAPAEPRGRVVAPPPKPVRAQPPPSPPTAPTPPVAPSQDNRQWEQRRGVRNTRPDIDARRSVAPQPLRDRSGDDRSRNWNGNRWDRDRDRDRDHNRDHGRDHNPHHGWVWWGNPPHYIFVPYYGGNYYYGSGFPHQRYFGGNYAPPYGYSAHRWQPGEILPPEYAAGPYFIDDYLRVELYTPPPGCRWIRVHTDALLVDMDSGEILDVIYDLFW